MVRFITDKIKPDEYLSEFAAALHVPYEKNRLEFPHEVADGFFQVFKLPTGQDVMYAKYQCHSNLFAERKNTHDEYYLLRFERVLSGDYLITTFDGEEYKERKEERSSVVLICSLFNTSYAIGPGTQVESLSVFFSRELLGKYLKLETYDRIFHHYLALKTKTLLFEPFDAEYRRILKEIHDMDKDHPAFTTMAINRVMDLVERFFSNLYEKRKQLIYRVDFSDEDIKKVRQVEKIITEDIRVPCPKIEDLAKMVYISPSKLKKLFKTMYDVPIYQYYLSQKMRAARMMLLTGKHSIKEVGMELGYNNLSNFSAAFKKEFGILPSTLIQEKKIGIGVLA